MSGASISREDFADVGLDYSDDEMLGLVADGEQIALDMAAVERQETPGIWAQEFLVNLGRIRMGVFAMHRAHGDIRFIAPRYGDMPVFEADDPIQNGRYVQVLLSDRPFEAHVLRAQYTLSEVLRRYPGSRSRCMVDHPGWADRHLIMCRGQFVLVWPVCDEHAEFLFAPERNVEWLELLAAWGGRSTRLSSNNPEG